MNVNIPGINTTQLSFTGNIINNEFSGFPKELSKLVGDYVGSGCKWRCGKEPYSESIKNDCLCLKSIIEELFKLNEIEIELLLSDNSIIKIPVYNGETDYGYLKNLMFKFNNHTNYRNFSSVKELQSEYPNYNKELNEIISTFKTKPIKNPRILKEFNDIEKNRIENINATIKFPSVFLQSVFEYFGNISIDYDKTSVMRQQIVVFLVWNKNKIPNVTKSKHIK